jgi:hypothetical protein
MIVFLYIAWHIILFIWNKIKSMIQYLFNKVRGTIINGLLGDKRFKCIQRRLNTLEEHCFYNSDDESEDD